MTEHTASCCHPAADRTSGARSGWRSIGRRGWLLITAVGVAGGLYLNWGWAVAIGLAPILIAVAPCAVMCGLGLCVLGGSKNSPAKTEETLASNPPERP